MFSQSEAIQVLTSILTSNDPTIAVGPGLDDVGVLEVRTGHLAVSVDYTNFKPLGTELGATSLFDKGYLLILHNVSDLIASGAKPLAAVVALGLPAAVSISDIEALGMGIRLAADECGLAIVGGDTKEAPCLALNATVFGYIGAAGHWGRGYAREGDLLFVTGGIGGVSASVVALKKKIGSADLTDKCRQALSKPSLPLDLASRLRNNNARIAAIDLSDGLGIDAHRLANASRVGLEIDGARIPMHPLADEVAKLLNLDPLQFAFGFGGDGQFIFALESQYEMLAIQAGAIKIGKILGSNERVLLTSKGQFSLPTFGHEDFTGIGSVDRLMLMLEHPLW